MSQCVRGEPTGVLTRMFFCQERISSKRRNIGDSTWEGREEKDSQERGCRRGVKE